MNKAPAQTDNVIDYKNLIDNYTFAATVKNAAGGWNHADYYLVGSIDGVDYYTPNNEDWGCIIAIDHTNRAAVDTTFYGMGDIYPGSDYRFIYNGERLVCFFERETGAIRKKWFVVPREFSPEVAFHLIKHSIWFECDPIPNDQYQFYVKEEAFDKVLSELKGYLGV